MLMCVKAELCPGGITREWISVTVSEMFDPKQGIFVTNEGGAFYHLNPEYTAPLTQPHCLLGNLPGSGTGSLVGSWPRLCSRNL